MWLEKWFGVEASDVSIYDREVWRRDTINDDKELYGVKEKTVLKKVKEELSGEKKITIKRKKVEDEIRFAQRIDKKSRTFECINDCVIFVLKIGINRFTTELMNVTWDRLHNSESDINDRVSYLVLQWLMGKVSCASLIDSLASEKSPVGVSGIYNILMNGHNTT
jgi:hypothetical protein